MHELSKGNHKSVIVGDFNINLLKILEKDAFSKFYDDIVMNCFIPTITSPTRFSTLHRSIIDNVLCRLSESSLASTSGISIDQFSDHLPYFKRVNIMSQKHNFNTFVNVSDYSHNNIIQLQQTLENSNIYNELDNDHDLNNDPNENDNILKIHIKSAMEEAIPSKKVRFNKHKHRKIPWITNGILKSMKYGDNLYENLKVMQPNSLEYSQSKLNISTHNRISRIALFQPRNCTTENAFPDIRVI